MSLATAPAPARPIPPAPPTGAPPRLRLVRYEPDPGDTDLVRGRLAVPAVDEARHRPPPPDDPRETALLRRHAHQVLRLALEALDGRRPLAHLAAHVEPCVLRYVRAAHARRPAGGASVRMTSLHAGRPCPGALEVAAVYRLAGRARALAARFEGRPDDPTRWRCVALRLL